MVILASSSEKYPKGKSLSAQEEYQVQEHIPKPGPHLVAPSVLVFHGRRGKQIDCYPLVDVVVLTKVRRSVFLVQLPNKNE